MNEITDSQVTLFQEIRRFSNVIFKSYFKRNQTIRPKKMFKTGSPECIAGIELKLVVEGRATESVVSEQLWDDEKNPVMIFVARRPGILLAYFS